MTIDEVYRLVQTFANKEQRGFIAPSEFNLLAKQAELELYNKRLSLIKEKSPTKKVQGIYGETLSPELAKQDIINFFVRKSLSSSGNQSYGSNFGGVSITCDYVESIFSNPSSDFNLSSNIPVDIVEPKDVNQIMRSSLVKPSAQYPVALVSGGGTQKIINVFPSDGLTVIVYCYYYDGNPTWNYVTISGKPVYDVSQSVGFRISSRCHGELVVKILEYLGVSIREAEVVQYAQANELKADS
jgi:hypothetical protein